MHTQFVTVTSFLKHFFYIIVLFNNFFLYIFPNNTFVSFNPKPIFITQINLMVVGICFEIFNNFIDNY